MNFTYEDTNCPETLRTASTMSLMDELLVRQEQTRATLAQQRDEVEYLQGRVRDLTTEANARENLVQDLTTALQEGATTIESEREKVKQTESVVYALQGIIRELNEDLDTERMKTAQVAAANKQLLREADARQRLINALEDEVEESDAICDDAFDALFEKDKNLRAQADQIKALRAALDKATTFAYAINA